ncbi:Ubiquitin-specific protease [Globisporangium polare]
MEPAAMERLRALLAAAVARSGAYKPPHKHESDEQTGGVVTTATAPGAGLEGGVSTATGSTLDTGAAEFTEADRVFWDGFTAESNRGSVHQLLKEIGLLIASTNVSDVKLVHLLKVLLLDPSFQSVGVLQVVQRAFRGLKYAKRWEVLILASRELVDAVYTKIYQPDTAQVALEFWTEILLGYQHEADLYQRNHSKLADVAKFLGDQRASDMEHTAEYEAMIKRFVLACAALVHCHRGYEQESYLLQLAMKQAFREDDLDHPTAADAEQLLRESAWVLSHVEVGKYLPSIEGKWVADEFSSDQHASGVSAPQNAGSVLLRKATNLFAHELGATIQNRDGTQKLRMNGYLFQQIPEMQVLLSQPENLSTTPWELEGHWSQVYASNAAAVARPSAPIVSSASAPWSCHACTMSNDASAVKCATCGTESPAKVTIQTSFDDVQGSNPAPFSATFDSSYSFMRMQWSRGEQQGVWLARKQSISKQFAIGMGIAAASNTMTDSTYLPMHAYSADGKSENVLLLEKPIVSSGSSVEITVQVWIRPQRPLTTDSPAQVVLGYGSEFQLSVSSTGGLMWEAAGGVYSLISSQLLNFDAFYHVTLLLGKQKMTMTVDGVSVGEVSYGDDVRGNLFASRSPVFSIGGGLTTDSTGVKAVSVFTGAILDLRIWSSSHPSTPVTTSLSGDEGNLLGYYPLVGNCQRVLMDLSRQENHATVFEAYRQKDVFLGGNKSTTVISSNFAPTTQLESLPVVLHFPTALGGEFVGSGRFSLVDGADALLIDRSDAGAALWHSNPVSILSGFQTNFQLGSAQTSDASGVSASTVFALCEASYWKLAPLITEASTLIGASSNSSVDSSLDRSSLFVSVDMLPSSDGSSRYNIGLYIRVKNHNYKLGQARQVVSEATAPVVQVKYSLPEKVVSVELGEGGVVFECAVDIALALGIQPASSIRTGLIFPAAINSSRASVRLNQWRFQEFASPASDSIPSVLASVYSGIASLQPTNPSSDAPDERPENTVICTRCSTDGSAIEQESFGCQTCNLLHGNTVCRICASLCHESHELVAMGVMSSACACHMRGSRLCHCSTPVDADDYPQLQHPITTLLWCCSKCTVINAAELSECSICGNKAPQAAKPPASSAAQPVSTSRALALIEALQPAPAATANVDWSCEACTMFNTGDATKCSICDTPRPKTAEPETRSEPASGLTTLYNAAEDVAKQSQMNVPSILPWFCSACTMENKSTDDTCYMCSTPKTVAIGDIVNVSEVDMALPPLTSDPPLLPVPIDLTHDESERRAAPVIPSGITSAAVENLKFLRGYKQTVAEATGQSEVVDAMKGSCWETTVGIMDISLQQSVVAEYIDGTYADKDGYLSGIARFNQDGVWKMEGKFKKLTQTQENALVLQWDSSATRFDGKWFRGDGSGDWKCVLAPSSSEFRGLNVVEDSKDATQLQPFYSGLINMKQNLTNVCYQNSFLQTLFMTQEFRRLILSSDLKRYVSVPQDGGHPASGSDILGCVQNLFARMTASQRPSLDSHGLQRCLPATFQAGRQQDTSDFAHYLIDSLSEQLSQQQDTVNGVSDIFGGVQATVLACKTCGKKSVNKEYFWELLLNMIDLRYTPITSITAVSGSSMDIATPSGFERMNHDVNKDRSGAPYVFLCVKRCPERKSTSSMDVDDVSLMPITDLVVKVAPYNDARPTMQGYERVELDLNFGGSTNVVGGKKQVYLFTRREPNGSPITDLQVIYGNESVPDGFKQIRVDLNQGEGTKVFLCYRCDMPITDFKIVNSGIPGYKMVDHLLNLSHEDPVKQYLAYQVGGNEPCLTDLKLVEGDEVSEYQEKGWTSIGSPTSITFDPNLPVEHPPTVPAQLMVRRGHGNPIFAVDVFRAPRQVPKYNDYEVIDVYPQANVNDIPSLLKGDWMASEDTDRTRKAVRIHSVSEPISETLVIKGGFEDKGEISAIAKITSTWSQSVSTTSQEGNPVYNVTGYWKSPKVKQSQLFDVELRPNADANLYAISGTIGDGKGRPVTVHGVQTSQSVKIKWPISELFVLRGDEKVPEGVKVVHESCSGRSGNLLAQTPSPHSLYLAVKREETPSSGFYASDVCVIYGEIDVVPEGYTCIQTTPGGHSANINDGTAGVPIFICYKRASGVPNEKVLMDLLPMWTSGPQVDTLPTGFAKIQHTPLGMEANLNQGTTGVAIHLCFAKSDPDQVVKPVENPLNGEYEITSSVPTGFGKFISLSVMESVSEARVVEGKFGTILHGHLPGSFRATLFKSAQKQKQIMLGLWSAETQGNPATMTDFMPASYPFELSLSEIGDELDGWWSGNDDTTASTTITTSPVATSGANASKGNIGGGSWQLMKDSHVRVAFKKDYGTEWKDGRLIFSERVWRHDIASMLSRFVATRTLGGDNSLSCSQCDRKTESRTHTVVVSPPAHLILTVKRMFYDWTQQKTRKSLHDVEFPALLTLPSLTEEDEEVVFDADDGNVSLRDSQRNRHYGLYGVLVHSGMTANSGHYYSFCRESDDSSHQLHLEDSPSSPWIKFNDMKMERSSWKEINRLVANSVSDAVYLLLYKRLSYPIPETAIVNALPEVPDSPSSGADDDEAMLLAKAMALSMSAASQKRQSVDETGEQESKREGDDDDNDKKSTRRHIQTSILKEVEKENTTFLRDTLGATSSPLHADDLHTLLVLRHSLPLHLRAILDQVQASGVATP